MFTNFKDDMKTSVMRYFPERQIYLRSGGEVSYFVLSTRVQLIASTVFATIVLWCIITILSLIWDINPIRDNGQQNQMIKAEYERLLQDAQAKYDSARQQLTLQQESFEKAAKSFQEKHAAIAGFVNQPIIEMSNASFSTTELADSITYSKGKILRDPIIRDNVRRVKRSDYIKSANIDMGNTYDTSLLNLDDTQNAILLSAEDTTIDNIERSRAIIEATDISVDSLLDAGNAGLGGPLRLIEPLDENGEWQDARINSIKIRAFEAKTLNDAVNALPLGYPVDAESYRTSAFGVRKDPFTKRPAMHEALDIASHYGAPIISTADGTVIFAGRKGGYGRVVEVDHGHGFVTRYAHMSKLHVKRGQKVTKGDKLGAMGSTGRSTSNHLHYEVRFQGKVYDPEKFIKAGQYVQ